MRAFGCLPRDGVTVLSPVFSCKAKRTREAVHSTCKLHDNVVIAIQLSNRLLRTLERAKRSACRSTRLIVPIGRNRNKDRIGCWLSSAENRRRYRYSKQSTQQKQIPKLSLNRTFSRP
jgi:hypothetical protein